MFKVLVIMCFMNPPIGVTDPCMRYEAMNSPVESIAQCDQEHAMIALNGSLSRIMDNHIRAFGSLVEYNGEMTPLFVCEPVGDNA